MKLKSKTREGGRIIKIHDQPKTPFQRLIDSEHLSQEKKQELLKRKETLNPFLLRQQLDEKLKWFFKIVDIRKRQSREAG